MGERPACGELREPLVELALAIASGDQRARVLEHAAGCPDCRRLLEELTRVGDELLQLGPEHEPPAGFELRVLERMTPPRRRGVLARLGLRGRRGAVAAALAAALAAGAGATAVVLRATRDERQLGSQLGAVLSRADGIYFAVTELRDGKGREAGLVYHYGGHPSWIFVALERALPRGRYVATLVSREGTTSELGRFRLGGRDRSFGATTDVDLLGVTELRLRDERGGPVYVAQFQRG
jgi:hypothetical protein